MPLTVSDVLRRHDALKKLRHPYEALWKDVTDFILPRRSFWDIEEEGGKLPAQKLYDGTGVAELQLLVDGTLGSMISPHLRWIHLTMEDRRQNEIPWVADWLEELEDIFYAEFARSNFYEAISEFFTDAAAIGTAVMFHDDYIEQKGLLFSTRHMKECYIAEGRDQRVDTVFREFNIPNRVAAQIWGNSLSLRRRDLVRAQPYAQARIIHACFPRSDRNPSKIDQLNKPWASLYIDKQFHENSFLDQGGYDTFPYLVWRWRKNSGEAHGWGPGTDAIQDVRRMNQVAKSNLQMRQIAGDPPLNVPEAMRGHERIVPRGYNYYTKPDEVIFPINLGQNYPIAKDEEEHIREQIRNIFRTKMYTLLEQLEGGPFTATEIRERQGEKATVQGPMIARLTSECLIPLIRRSYAILEQNGLLPPPPEELAAGGRIHIEFNGPLALQTKKYHQSQGIDNGIIYIQAMREMFPESLDNVDGDELMRIGLDSKAMPQRAIREKPQVTKVREIRAEEAQREEQQAVGLEQQKMLAQNAEKLNKPMNPDSMLAGIGKAAKTAPKR